MIAVHSLFAAVFTVAVASSAGLAQDIPELDADRIEAHVRILSDDALEGRISGSAGYREAVSYVEEQYRLLGLSPAGEDGTYQAEVPLQRVHLDSAQSGLTVHLPSGDQHFSAGDAMLLFPEGGNARGVSRTRAVFVGFGVQAPAHGIDDFEGLDLTDRLVVVMEGAHPFLGSEESAHHGNLDTKARLAADLGAIGVLSILPFGRNSMSSMAADTVAGGAIQLQPSPDGPEGLLATGYIGISPLFALFNGAQIQPGGLAVHLATGDFPRFEMEHEVTLSQTSRRELYSDSNVIAYLPGSDPDLRDEYVVVSAHLDHVGVAGDNGKHFNGQCQERQGDSICNGALDNAAGIAIMLDMARALSASPPRRSVLFIALAAEEQGLLGSEYFAENPTIGDGIMVANINLDMPVVTYPFADIVALGADHSSLGEVAARAAQAHDAVLAPDPAPAEAVFVRSDQYNFVLHGVPALFLRTGPNSQDGGGTHVFNNHYHQVSDQMDGVFPILMDQAARFGAINARIVLDVANADERPSWNGDNPFQRPADTMR